MPTAEEINLAQAQAEAARREAEKDLENLRLTNHQNLEKMRTRLDLVRTAKEVLLENARSKPVESRDVSATDITAFAEELVQFVHKT